MKKSELKSLVKTVIKEMSELGTSINVEAKLRESPNLTIKENVWQRDFDNEEQSRMKKWKLEMGGNVSAREEHSYRYGYRDGYNSHSKGH